MESTAHSTKQDSRATSTKNKNNFCFD